MTTRTYVDPSDDLHNALEIVIEGFLNEYQLPIEEVAHALTTVVKGMIA